MNVNYGAFNIGDVVELHNDNVLLLVVGVVHDAEILYVADDTGHERKVHFCDVTNHWRKYEG